MPPPRLRKLASTTPREWLDFGHAQWALIAARARLARNSAGPLLTRDSAAQAVPSNKGFARAAQLARAVERASRFAPFRPSCLVQALALQHLLNAAGLSGARIEIGVRHNSAGGVAAHAWVTYGSTVLYDSDGGAAEYAVLRDLRVDWV